MDYFGSQYVNWEILAILEWNTLGRENLIASFNSWHLHGSQGMRLLIDRSWLRHLVCILIWTVPLVTVCPGQPGKQLRYQHQQEPISIHFDELDGLPSSNIYSVLADRSGFLWVSTDEGACRFDGSTFECFDVDDGLSDNEIFSMFEDSFGRVWFLTYSGIPSFFFQGKFYNPTNLPALGAIRPGNFLSSMFEDGNHDLYLGTKNGVVYLISSDGKVSEFDRIKGGGIYSIARGRNQRLEVSASIHKVAVYEGGKREFIIMGDSIFRFPPRVIKAKEDGYLVGNGAELHFGNDRGRWESIEFDPTHEQLVILYLAYDVSGRLWVCTSKGAFYRGPQNKWRKVLEGLHVSGVARDFEGGYWFSTNEGLYYYPNFDVTLFSSGIGESDPDLRSITALMNDGDSVVLAGYRVGVIQKVDVELGVDLGLIQVPMPPNREQGVIHRLQSGGSAGVLISTEYGFFRMVNGVIDKCHLPNIKSFGALTESHFCLCHTFGWNITNTSIRIS
ncbi:MAG: two-component regulator propeller domain-containing protein [Bacteroidia bacterium]